MELNSNPKIVECKVLLVEDHPLFRERLAILINRDLGMTVCGETDNVVDAMAILRRERPDIAVVDISLRGSSGLDLLKDIRAEGLQVAVLVLSMHAEETYAERALRAGARGYIMKSEVSSEIIGAIRAVRRGEYCFSSSMMGRILDRMSSGFGQSQPSGVELLADRELEVFELIGRGLKTREIAANLNLGESTVETCRARIREKLGLRHAAELTQRAVRWAVERPTSYRPMRPNE